MTLTEKLELEHSIAQPIFCELFKHDSNTIRKIVQRIVNANTPQYLESLSDLFQESNGGVQVYKTICDDEPDKIRIASWSSIEISWVGVYIQPEQRPQIQVCKFGETFKLPEIV